MRFIDRLEPSARTRTLATAVSLVGVVASPRLYALGFLILVCTGILTTQGKAAAFARFVIKLWIPLALTLFIVWGLVVRGSPSTGSDSGAVDGFRFAATVSLRVAALAALFQAAVLSLEGLRLARFLRTVGFSATGMSMIVSVFNLWPDFQRRAEEVVAARCARGLMSDRRLWTRVRQVPWALRTLFVRSLGNSLDRAIRWEAERLPNRLVDVIETGEAVKTNNSVSFCWFLAAISWTALALW